MWVCISEFPGKLKRTCRKEGVKILSRSKENRQKDDWMAGH